MSSDWEVAKQSVYSMNTESHDMARVKSVSGIEVGSHSGKAFWGLKVKDF